MTSTVFVHTNSARKSKWSRYEFPWSVDAFAQLADDLYIRHGDEISVVDEDVATDDVAGVAVGFDGMVWWGWLDLGSPGMDKELEGFDVVSSGTPSVSIGYDQRNVDAFTTPYAVDADTMAGGMIPLPVVGPSLSVKVEFAPGEAWSLQRVGLWLNDRKAGA